MSTAIWEVHSRWFFYLETFSILAKWYDTHFLYCAVWICFLQLGERRYKAISTVINMSYNMGLSVFHFQNQYCLHLV